jgi:hypothetical protein
MQQQARIEEITLYAAGSIAGIPGEHPAGILTVDWNTRQVLSMQPLPAPEALETDAAASVPPESVAPVVPQPQQVTARPSSGG